MPLRLACLLLTIMTLAHWSFGEASGQGSPTSTVAPNISTEIAVPTVGEKTPAWYEQEFWPLAVSVVAIIISNAVAIVVVYLQSSRSFRAIIRQREIEALLASLTQFYDPLLALLHMNGAIFSKTGPPSFPEGHIERESAAKVWAETKKKIIKNNRQIESIIRNKSHLMHNSDDINAYKDLLVHAAMYETFQSIKTDRYVAFQFPINVEQHLACQRSKALAEYRHLTGTNG